MYLIQPFILIKLLWRSRKIPSYRKRWAERYGYLYKKIQSGGIMLHSVSVGETITAFPLIKILRQNYPLLPITITTMTPTSSDHVKLTFGNHIYHFYLPYDLPGAINRFLDKVKPILVIIMETELWPNLIKILHKRGIPIVIANARLSAPSAAKYRKFINFFTNIMQCITLIAAQNKEDGYRFLELGLKINQLAIIGSLKFDISITYDLAFQALVMRYQWASNRQVWIATSTHEGEEILILQAHRKLLKFVPSLLLILVPRHPERFLAVKYMTIKAGFNYMLRSSGKIPDHNIQVVIGDTMGELMLLYGIADLAFVGGSLVKRGGHNPLEAAAHGIPIVMGPYNLNFSEICNKLNEAGGLIIINDLLSLVNVILKLLINDHYRLYCGCHAIKVLHQNKGALQKLITLLKPYLPT